MKLRQEIIKKWQIINKEKFNGSAFRFKYRIQKTIMKEKQDQKPNQCKSFP